ncbi:MBL fold metallo-hydrolase [Arsenicicoccus piscis]|uniref:MBL fold metallo-hydrolase n=1 Tax=Arsenicicoccus piscis TaxID=673954 RepID=A0ABQ6HJR9_9MICO|nr:MBL fold metallo-hydrolase [Arsenicicoccus piscis]MCH8628358.1 MBL fold metallo-hydrolase [Arsenicicoccus piscis]GMA18631.1 MBL fold metallo-hydrolase [Arsenicicoccus piscis]
MRLTIIGCSGSFPGPDSPASCYLLSADDADGRTHHVVLDLGNGALGVLQQHLPLGRLDGVFLSHLHPDHCLDLCGLYVAQRYDPAGVRPPIPVWGPSGTHERLAAAYGDVDAFGMGREFTFTDWTVGEPVRLGPFVVTPYPAWHPVEAYGLRVEADGAVLAYSGDTDSTDSLSPLFADATLVLADAAFVEGRDLGRGIHLTGRRAAEAALAAGGVQRLMLTHIPAWNDPERCRADAAAVWPGEVELATPGAVYELWGPGYDRDHASSRRP